MNQKWEIYTRGIVPYYRIDIFHSLRAALLKYGKEKFIDTVFACENGKVWWAWEKEGAEKWTIDLKEKLNDKSKRFLHYQEYEVFCKNAITACKHSQGVNLPQMDKRQMISICNFLEKETADAMGMINIDLDVFDMFYGQFLQDKIKEKIKSNDMIADDKTSSSIYKILSTPIYKTYVLKEEEAIIKLALKKEVSEKDITKICQNFWWISLGWENIIPRNFAYYKKEIEKYSEKKNLKKIIREMENRLPAISIKREKIIKKYKLGREIKELLEIFDKFVYFHDLRKETQVRVIYSFDLLSREVASRFNIPDDDREWYSRREIIKILQGKKVDVKEIKKRKKAIIVFVEKRGIKVFSGKEASEKIKKEFCQKIDNILELKGIGATKGKITAKVKVCNGIEEARKKIKAGDILVTGMTLPDYAPIMKIAGAIITDEGGITCHAAIMSRELGKPCIIGTKIATKVLHDGDLVEVDADKGVVKIIKKKK